jgi:hypothetical protein
MKNEKKLSTGGPESGSLDPHATKVTGTCIAAPNTRPSRQTVTPVITRHLDKRNRLGKKRKMVVL